MYVSQFVDFITTESYYLRSSLKLLWINIYLLPGKVPEKKKYMYNDNVVSPLKSAIHGISFY